MNSTSPIKNIKKGKRFRKNTFKIGLKDYARKKNQWLCNILRIIRKENDTLPKQLCETNKIYIIIIKLILVWYIILLSCKNSVVHYLYYTRQNNIENNNVFTAY